MKKFLFVSLVFLLLVSNTFNQKQPAKNSKNRSQTKSATRTQVPKGWKLVDLDNFSFLLPESMEDKKARGFDSAVWRFEDTEMELHIDSGIYTNDFQDLKESYKVKEERTIIDGKNVKFFTWVINKNISNVYAVNKDGSIKPRDVFKNHFAIGVYFQRGQRRYTGTNFVITTKTLKAQETAKKILYSIKFKK